MFAYRTLLVLVAMVLAGGPVPVQAAEESSRRAAEDLVQKFIDGPAEEAEAAAKQRRAVQRRAAQRRAAERRAQERQAEQRRAEKRLAEERRAARRLAEQRRAEKRRAEERRAEQQRAEQRRVEQLRAAQRLAAQLRAEQRRAERIQAEQQRAEQLRVERRLAEQRLAEQRLAKQRQAEQQQAEARRAEAEKRRLRALSERRLRELDELSERMRAARAARQQSAPAAELAGRHDEPRQEPVVIRQERLTSTSVPRPPEPKRFGLGGPAADEPDTKLAADEPLAVHKQVTILLVMRPGRRSPRRFARHADPIVCLGARCFISRGFEADAREMPRRRALGPGNSLGRRSGACRATPLCVFRNVDLEDAEAFVQPIDIGWLRHDRRSPVRIAGDNTCEITKGRLFCRSPIEAADYRLWIVPEPVAEQAGSEALRRALSRGLRSDLKHAGLAAHRIAMQQ